MDSSYHPIQTGAIMMKGGGAETIVNGRKPARPIFALLKGPIHGRAAVRMRRRIPGDPRYSKSLPERTGAKYGQQGDEEDDPQASRNPHFRDRMYRHCKEYMNPRPAEQIRVHAR